MFHSLLARRPINIKENNVHFNIQFLKFKHYLVWLIFMVNVAKYPIHGAYGPMGVETYKFVTLSLLDDD